MLRLLQQFYNAFLLGAQQYTVAAACFSPMRSAQLLCRQGTVIALMALHHIDRASEGLHLSWSCHLQHQRHGA